MRRALAALLLLAILPACGALIGLKHLTADEDDAGDAAGNVEGGPEGASNEDGGDASTSCADVTRSAEHCGRCGHSCLGGTCKSSVCQPTALATGQGTVSGIALDDTYVYFTSLSNNIVARVPKAGGRVETLAAAPGVRMAKRLAVNATHVYWANADLFSGAIARCPIAGCAGVPEVLSQPEEPIGIALDPGFVYWADRNASKVRRKPLDGGADQLVATTTGGLPVAVAVSGPSAFWIEDFNGDVNRSNAAGGGEVFIGVSGPSGRDLALDPSFVYWGAAQDPGDQGKISRAPRDGGGPTQQLGPARGDPMAIAVDGTLVYWTAWERATDGGVLSGGVYACGHSGCGAGPTVLGAAEDLPRGIATDATAVYWGANGVVMKLAKP